MRQSHYGMAVGSLENMMAKPEWNGKAWVALAEAEEGLRSWRKGHARMEILWKARRPTRGLRFMGGPRDTPFTKTIKTALQRGSSVSVHQEMQTTSEGRGSKLESSSELGSWIAVDMLGLLPGSRDQLQVLSHWKPIGHNDHDDP